MTPPPKDSAQENIKALTEKEIQQRLYGKYQNSWKGTHPDSPSRTGKELGPVTDSEWTGAEILTSELKRLRSDLIALRQERERLATQLEQHIHSCQNSPGSSWEPQGLALKKTSRNFLKKLMMVAILSVCVGMPVGFRFLQASPAGNDPSPFTIQVAVYDVKSTADQAMIRLQELGYPAFFVETPRPNGKRRYRIYVGRFVTKGEAELERERLTADPRFADAFVRLQ